jgi:hypothetical protein
VGEVCGGGWGGRDSRIHSAGCAVGEWGGGNELRGKGQCRSVTWMLTRWEEGAGWVREGRNAQRLFGMWVGAAWRNGTASESSTSVHAWLHAPNPCHPSLLCLSCRFPASLLWSTLPSPSLVPFPPCLSFCAPPPPPHTQGATHLCDGVLAGHVGGGQAPVAAADVLQRGSRLQRGCEGGMVR